jgi:hypothetical protein
MGSPSYKDKETVVEMYREKGMTQKEMAEELGCPVSTLSYWFDKFNIDTSRPRAKPARHTFDAETGYEKWRTSFDYERTTVMVHHLVLIAEGEDPRMVFSDNVDTHHKNGFPADNRPENLGLIDKKEHGRLHAEERWK